MTPDKDETEFLSFVNDLIKSDRLEGAALGIAKQAVAKGQATLSPLQKGVFEDAIKQYVVSKCPVCHQSVPWSEMLHALEKGTCAACKPA